jgi:hypothetical protein
MGTDGFGQSGMPHGHFEGFVDDTGGDMMAAGDAGTGVNGHGMGEKDVLPAPCRGGLGRRARQGMRQVHRPMALRQILVMQGVDPGQMLLEEGDARGGKGGAAICIPLPRTDGLSCCIAPSMSVTRRRTASRRVGCARLSRHD